MMYQSNNNKVQPWFVQKSDFQMSGSPPAVSEACADEEGGWSHSIPSSCCSPSCSGSTHFIPFLWGTKEKWNYDITPYNQRIFKRASDGNNNGWFLEPRVSLIWLKGDQSEAVWSSIPPKQHQWHQWRSPFIGRWKPFPSRFNRREGEGVGRGWLTTKLVVCDNYFAEFLLSGPP